MPRRRRERSESGIYHVMFRGINQQIIFNDDEDYQKFLDILRECKTISECKIFAYCLMRNHVHLLLKVEKEELPQIMKRIGVRYVYWYNWKYSRRGHLFQDRYKSEVVEDDKYLLTLIRYIHQNPIKAGIAEKIKNYQYSSYIEYLRKDNTIADISFAIEMVGEEEFIRFNNEENEDICMEYDYSDYKITDVEAKEIIRKISNCDNTEQFLRLGAADRDRYIVLFKGTGMSIRQISRLTGVSFGIIRKST